MTTRVQDFVVSYPTVRGHAQCHVRLLDDAPRPLAVVCSQFINHRGGSVTNYVGEIRQELQSGAFPQQRRLLPEVHERVREAVAKPTADTVIDALVALVTLDTGYVVRTAFKTVSAVWDTVKVRQRRAQRISDVLWVEHYPAGSLGSLFADDKYALVTFDENGMPDWEHVTLAQVVERSGFSEQEIRKDRGSLVLQAD